MKDQGTDTNATEGQAGFSLVELLVVMLILGLLAAIAIPSFLNQIDKADDADAKATARRSADGHRALRHGERRSLHRR